MKTLIALVVTVGISGMLAGCGSHDQRGMGETQMRPLGKGLAPLDGVPRPLGKWMEASVGAATKITTRSDRVFIADGSVGPVISRSHANYYAMIGPTTVGSINPNLAVAEAELKNSAPFVHVDLGMIYASGVRPRIRTSMMTFGTSSTHIAVQVKLPEAGGPEIHRAFLLYAEPGQSTHITPVNSLSGPLAGQSLAIVAPDNSNPSTDHWYIEVQKMGGNVTFSAPKKVIPNDGSEVGNFVHDMLKRAEAAGIPHP